MILSELKIELFIVAIVLTFILVVSFGSRAKVFCQYLKYMTGIKLTPREVKKVFRQGGKPGVRELFLDLLIRADLDDDATLAITPDSQAQKPISGMLKK